MAVRKRKIWVVAALSILGVGALLLAGAVTVVHHSAGNRLYADLASIPANDIGLVLGTSRYLRGGLPNAHFDHRMAAAAELFKAGKVRHLLLSGDNGTRGYDEPADMRSALLALGVPADALSLDDAGFRTLDSVARAKEVFGQRRVTIITDRFHAYRAVFLARHKGLDAIAYPCGEVELRYSARSRMRECLADVKACLDLWVFHTQPRFLGEPVSLRVAVR